MQKILYPQIWVYHCIHLIWGENLNRIKIRKYEKIKKFQYWYCKNNKKVL